MNIGSQHADKIWNTEHNYGGGHAARFDAARDALGRVPLTAAQRDEVEVLLQRAANRAGSDRPAAVEAVVRAQDRLKFWGVVGTTGAAALTALGHIATALA
jgi:hypothetical protein